MTGNKLKNRLLGAIKSLAIGRNSARRRKHFTPKQYTRNARLVLKQAEVEARQLGHFYLGVGHLLLALTSKSTGLVAQVLAEFEVTSSLIEAAWFPYISGQPDLYVQVKLPPVSDHSGLELKPDPYFLSILELAGKLAGQLNHPYIGVEHLLLAVSHAEIGIAEGVTAQALGAKYPLIQSRLLDLLSQPRYQPFAYTNPENCQK